VPRKAEGMPKPRRQSPTTGDDSDYAYFFGDYLDEGYRPRQPQEVKELPPIENTLSTSTSLSDHLQWQLSLQAFDETTRTSATRSSAISTMTGIWWPRWTKSPRWAAGSADEVEKCWAWCRGSIRSAWRPRDLQECLCCSCATSGRRLRRPRRSSPSISGCCRTTRCGHRQEARDDH